MAKQQPLDVGDQIPAIELKDQNDQLINVNNELKNGPIVVYFYPKDDTPGCTKEACRFRDTYEDFTSAGVKVFGVSGDSPKSHKSFADKYNLPFTLLSDKGNYIRKAFGVPSTIFGLIPGRVTYVIDTEGKIRGVYNSQTNAVQHVEEALKIIESL